MDRYRINYIDANGMMRFGIADAVYVGEEINRLIIDQGLVVTSVIREGF